MKNLKRVLSLVLVIALAFSLMTFAGAVSVSDYSDADDITNTDAVGLLSGLGGLSGFPDGTFGPLETLTREQAAKTICYIMIGSTIADDLTTSVSSFTDVAADRWSAAYIEYCVDQGIINGYGDGTFGPTDPVTGAQMMKMLLVALGYGGKGEFTSSSWEIQSLILGTQTGLRASVTTSPSAPAPRQEVAQYLFNALFIDRVAFNTTTNTYQSDPSQQHSAKTTSACTPLQQSSPTMRRPE
jgi:hypothetical protein